MADRIREVLWDLRDRPALAAGILVVAVVLIVAVVVGVPSSEPDAPAAPADRGLAELSREERRDELEKRRPDLVLSESPRCVEARDALAAAAAAVEAASPPDVDGLARAAADAEDEMLEACPAVSAED